MRRLAVALVLLAACSGSDDAATPAPTTTTTTVPSGPTAELEELTGGAGVFLAGVPALPDGWTETEHVASGTATSYEGELPTDGRASLTEGTTAEYRTRVLIRRPPDFGGTVVVEWLNVSGGVDAGPDLTFLSAELERRGVAWVGVSAQRIGVEGGDVAVSAGGAGGPAGKGLKAIDPERYGSLAHPGDAFAYDVFTQVGRAARALPGATHVLAVGESQSAFALTTYVNGVEPLAEGVFDGFLLHSRGGAALPLGSPGEAVSIAAAIGGPPVRIRDDRDAPVFVLETESDLTGVIGYLPARQPDGDRFRAWEVAGTAHADAFLVGPATESLDCGVPINDGPQRFAVRAALRHLEAWVREGTPPPSADPLSVVDGRIERDADGIAVGGLRLPPVEVPTARLSGEPGPKGGVLCLLLGSTVPFTDEQLVARYDARSAYLDAYERALDAAVDAGHALAEDRAELLGLAEPDRIPER